MFAKIYIKLMSVREESFLIKIRQTRQGVIHTDHILEFDQDFPKKKHFQFVQKASFHKFLCISCMTGDTEVSNFSNLLGNHYHFDIHAVNFPFLYSTF